MEPHTDIMTYTEALNWLYSTQKVGIKLGLENITRLLGLLGITTTPGRDQKPHIFHVAGTNGKGSVCAMLDAVCRAGGYRTALFTSPHLVTFRERIRVDGEMISEEAVAEGLSRIRSAVASWDPHPTFFELATALALDWFQRQGAEVIVLETGMGGRLDATNAVTPAVCAITSLSLDHRQFLGDTLDAIAGEKAGIFKPGIPALSVPQSLGALRVLEATAHRVGAPFRCVEKPVATHLPLAGSHQRINAALALTMVKEAGMEIPPETVEKGLAGVVWPGRFQRVEGLGGIPLILDGAHNEAAASRLVETWAEEFPGERPVILLGVLRDKDVPAICREFAKLAAEFIVTPLRNVRTSTAEDLAREVRAVAPQTRCFVVDTTEEGISLAQTRARELSRRVLITGSLFLVGEVLGLLQGSAAEMSAQ
jgi:dihydrofolate synthase / folylpolyglutamate synthase